MIFIITHKQDYTVDFVVNKLNKRKIKYYRFNCEDIDEKGYSLRLGEKESFKIGSAEDINSVWFRRTKLPEVHIASEAERLFLLNDYNTLLSNIYTLIKAKKWMSRPRDVYEAENKLLQLRIAEEIGFLTPETLVTSKREELGEFAAKYNNRVIIKPITQGRIEEVDNLRTIFTNLLKQEHLDNLSNFSLTPSLFQPLLEK